MTYKMHFNMFEDGKNVRVVTLSVDATDLGDLGTKLATVDLTYEASTGGHADITVTRWVENG